MVRTTVLCKPFDRNTNRFPLHLRSRRQNGMSTLTRKKADGERPRPMHREPHQTERTNIHKNILCGQWLGLCELLHCLSSASPTALKRHRLCLRWPFGRLSCITHTLSHTLWIVVCRPYLFKRKTQLACALICFALLCARCDMPSCRPHAFGFCERVRAIECMCMPERVFFIWIVATTWCSNSHFISSIFMVIPCACRCIFAYTKSTW